MSARVDRSNPPCLAKTIPGAREVQACRGRPLIMGVLNVSPDSFSDGGLYDTLERAVCRGRRMVEEGADVIDIGGVSTRPGAVCVALEEELRRVIPVVEGLAASIRSPISIDTSKATVASRAILAGASIVNDVTALRGDEAMAQTVARSGAAVILMHMQGSPATMQRDPRYHDVVYEVAQFLREAAHLAERAGIERGRILLDPGLGFGKTVAHNLTLIQKADQLTELGYPVVIGASRKSFIGRVLDARVDERLGGSLACVAAAYMKRLHMVRVHDVRETSQLIRMLEAIDQQGSSS